MISWIYSRGRLLSLSIYKSKNSKLGFGVRLEFHVSQDSRDEKLFRSFIKYLTCGNIHKSRDTLEYRVTKFDDIVNKVIPFFQKYKIKGVKGKYFEDFCKVAELMKENKHLTPPIKASMNRGLSKELKKAFADVVPMTKIFS